MSKYAHNYVEKYEGLVGFGLDRETDENTIICYLQMFSDDDLMKHMIGKMPDEELEEVFTLLTRLLKKHPKEDEYHRLFLKD